MTRYARVGFAALILLAFGGCALASGHRTTRAGDKTNLVDWPANWQNGKIGRPEIPDSLGVNIHFTTPRPGEMKMLAAAGFRWIRMDFTWQVTEKKKGHYDFKPYDTLLASLRPYHIRPIFILDYANPLYQHGQSPSTPKARRAFCRWVAAAMKHFKGRGIMWEMWNEPNLSFTGGAVPYAKLAVAVGKTIRRVAPHELYVGPALALLNPPALSFMKVCAQHGVLKYFDAVTVHPYRMDVHHQQPETVIPEYHRLRKLLNHYSPVNKHIPIISGEWGYATSADGKAAVARYAVREFLVNLSHHIPLSIWYDWHDDGPNPKNVQHHFGLVLYPYHRGRHPVYTPKPGYLAIRTLTTQLNGCHFVRRLKVGHKNDYVLLFHGPQGDCIAAWKVGAKRQAVQFPLKPGHYRVTNELGSKTRTVAVSRHAKTLKLTLSHDPQYLVPEGKQ